MSNATLPTSSLNKTSIPSLYDLTLEQLTQQLTEWGEPAFRAKQIWRWLYQRFAQDLDEMSDLGKPLRARLREHFALKRISASAQQKSSDGWTRKWLLKFPDGSEIETVLMDYDGGFGKSERRTACISSQAGCAMNCGFCATGQMGFLRNLRAGEIIEQVVWVARALQTTDDGRQTTARSSRLQSRVVGRLGFRAASSSTEDRLSNLVLMGMGEPFANYNNVMEAVRRLMHPENEGGFGLGARKITISTVGLVPGIRKFADVDTQVNLAVSLHAATDELRNQLVPINVKYPLKDVIKATHDYIKKTNRRVSYEWALIDGVNDTLEQAKALVDVVDKTFPIDQRHLVHVNMIPLNPTKGYRGHASVQERRAKFQAVLEQAGIPNTMRVRRGIDIAAGCGQLKSEAR